MAAADEAFSPGRGTGKIRTRVTLAFFGVGAFFASSLILATFVVPLEDRAQHHGLSEVRSDATKVTDLRGLALDDAKTCQAEILGNLQSWFEFKKAMETNPNWCRAHTNLLAPPCECMDEVHASKPVALSELKRWERTFKMNLRNLKRFGHHELDLVLWGDYMVERWYGMSYAGTSGFSESGDEPAELANVAPYRHLVAENARVFSMFFDVPSDIDRSRVAKTALKAIPLGSTHDETPNMLFELENGFMETLNPSVWWIVVGHNDVQARCSFEGILAGILKIVTEILQHRPNAQVVVNSVLPNLNETSSDWNDIISPLNNALDCFAASDERVSFFNASEVFLLPVCSDGVHYCRNESLFVAPNETYPTPLGYTAWGEAISQAVKSFLRPATQKKKVPTGKSCLSKSECRHDCKRGVCTHKNGLLPNGIPCNNSPECFTGRCDKKKGEKVCLDKLEDGRWCNEASDCVSNKCRKRRCVGG